MLARALARRLAQNALYRFADGGVQVDRIDELRPREVARPVRRAPGRWTPSAGPKFSRRWPVIRTRGAPSQERVRERRQAGDDRRLRLDFFERQEERVNGGVAGDEDFFRRHAFPQQVLARALGGGEVQRGQARDDDSVGFLGPGGVQVPGPQARFDMRQRDAVVEGG